MDYLDYLLTVRNVERFDESRVGLPAGQYVRINTTVDDGSIDVVRIVSEQIRADVTSAATKYGKYVVYGAAGLIAFYLGRIWWRYRKRGR